MNIKMKKRNQLWEKLFTKRIEGDSFIQSPIESWNSIPVPKWRKIVASTYPNCLEQKMDLQGVYNLLLKSGITIDQSYTLSIVPIEKFLQAIEKNQPN